ncbi:MAG: glutamate--tRNA ligase, partial [Haloferula sp.]
DAEKSAWLNQQHLLKLDSTAFAEAARPFVEKAGLPIDDRYPAAAAAVQEKVRLLSEVPGALDFLLLDEISIDEGALAKVAKNDAAKDLLLTLASAFEAAGEWTADSAKEIIGSTAKANGAKPGQLMFPTRVALSGKGGGPDLGDILVLLGQAKSVARVRALGEQL